MRLYFIANSILILIRCTDDEKVVTITRPVACEINRSKLGKTERSDGVKPGISELVESLIKRSAGVKDGDTIVLYGDNNNWFAAYAYWYFKLYGHQDVKLLDGGRKKWELESRELVADVPSRAATTYSAADQDTSIRAFRDDVVDGLGSLNLVDVRSPDEYAGRLLAPAHLPQEQSQRPGHVPTAVSVPWSKAANDDGTFKSDEDLKALYEGKGVDLSQDTIAYCRIGERSAHTWFVLHELLGQPARVEEVLQTPLGVGILDVDVRLEPAAGRQLGRPATRVVPHVALVPDQSRRHARTPLSPMPRGKRRVPP